MSKILIALVVVCGLVSTVLFVSLLNLFDPSPTKDDRCRGGHDY